MTHEDLHLWLATRLPELQKPCPGYEYFGHEPLAIESGYSTLDETGKSDKIVASLVKQALLREDPSDDWLRDALDKNHLGDTAVREIAYSVVLSNTPHPQCQDRRWVPNVTTDSLLEVLREEGFYVEIRGWVPAKVRENPDLLEDAYCGRVSPNDEQLHGDEVEAWASTAHEALCRAARKVLEAAG